MLHRDHDHDHPSEDLFDCGCDHDYVRPIRHDSATMQIVGLRSNQRWQPTSRFRIQLVLALPYGGSIHQPQGLRQQKEQSPKQSLSVQILFLYQMKSEDPCHIFEQTHSQTRSAPMLLHGMPYANHQRSMPSNWSTNQPTTLRPLLTM